MIETSCYLFLGSISGLYIYKLIKDYYANKNCERFTTNNFPKRGLANINDKFINKKKVKFDNIVRIKKY